MRNWLSILPFLVVIGLVLGIIFINTSPSLSGSGPRVGTVAPDIQGTDLDGVEFKLSDYRGKVVLLSFSGEWCSACRTFHRHEHALVEELQGKPFVALTVNTDESPDVLKQAQSGAKHPIRAWFDGMTNGYPGGPITSAWEVNSFPTICVIDANGVIRFKDAGFNPDTRVLDRTISRYVKEAEGS